MTPTDAAEPAAGDLRVVDLFSGAGGMSYGFAAHPAFRIAGAADAQLAKPSSKRGSLGCNRTYEANVGVVPVDLDLGATPVDDVLAAMGVTQADVLLACPPCTGFTRALAVNHLRDDERNSLVGRVADYVAALRPGVVVVENARELVMGRFRGHLRGLTERLDAAGYDVAAHVHLLHAYGLPQRRERAVVVAVRRGLPLLGLDDLWRGYAVDAKATHVRRALWNLATETEGDPMHVAPAMTERNRRRLAAIPKDGGSWVDLLAHPDGEELLTPSMRDRARRGDLGSHPDVYGRLWWDRPAATIKRECAHIGNGRYAHPEYDRLCTVREMAVLQGFPVTYEFTGSLSNRYRQIGDAVPPLVSHQLAHVAYWTLSGERPDPESVLLPGTHLAAGDVTLA